MLSMPTMCQLTMLAEERDLFITKCCNFSALMKMDADNQDICLPKSNLKLLTGGRNWTPKRCWDENYPEMWWFTSCCKSDGWIAKYAVQN